VCALTPAEPALATSWALANSKPQKKKIEIFRTSEKKNKKSRCACDRECWKKKISKKSGVELRASLDSTFFGILFF
jgi:hypothetical protein